MAEMENSTSTAPYEWEYYYYYLDPEVVDESKLKYNKCKSLCFVDFFCICLFVMKITAILPFPFRLNCYYILDNSGSFCGISLSRFESNVSQWKLAKVGVMHNLFKYQRQPFTFFLNRNYITKYLPIIVGVTDPESNDVTERLPNLRLHLDIAFKGCE